MAWTLKVKRRQSLSRKVVGAILAAGASSRFGSPKQLAKFGDKTLIETALITLIQSDVNDICVVLGCAFDAVNKHLQTHMKSSADEFTVLNNQDWGQGLSSSIRKATAYAIDCDATDLLLMVCDQPYVTSELINKLLEVSERSHIQSNPISMPEQASSSIIACEYGNSVGIPAIFPQHYFTKLLALQGDRGAKSVILQSADPIYVAFEKGDVDIDIPSDLDRKMRLVGS